MESLWEVSESVKIFVPCSKFFGGEEGPVSIGFFVGDVLFG